MVSSQIAAMIRAKVGEFRTETCEIYRTDWGVDDFGAQVRTEVSVASGVTCRLIFGQRSFQSAVMKSGEQKVMAEELRVSLPVGTVLAPDYDIEISGVRYQVQRIVNNLTDDAQVQAVVTRRR